VTPSARRQWLVAMAAALAALGTYHVCFFQGFQSSDGANYATVARNLLDGRGLTSSVIQPGLMTQVPSTRQGQAYVTQKPLWPTLLAGWFWLFGATPVSAVLLSYLFCLTAAGVAWILGYRLSGKSLGGHLAVGLLLSNPHYVGNVLAVYNVALHSALIALLFLLLWAPPTVPRAAAVGVVLALAVVTREPSIFVFPAIAFCWAFDRPSATGTARAALRAHLVRVLGCLAVAAAIVAASLAVEKKAVARAAGTSATPTLRATFFYYTPVLDANWYFSYDDPAMRIDPRRYFAEHPRVLIDKILFQLRVCFVEQTLLPMQSSVPWFLPIFAPWVLPDRAARRVAVALLITLGMLVAAGSVTTLHLQYFLAFLPVIEAGVAATAVALLAQLGKGAVGARGWTAVGVAAYALAPIAFNVGRYATGWRLPTGEYGLRPEQVRTLAQFIVRNTAADAVVACSHSPLMAWHTGRVIVQYSGSPDYRISNRPMWHRIDAHVPIDAIVLNSWANETPDLEVLDGFRMVKAIKTPEVKAWLFRRP